MQTSADSKGQVKRIHGTTRRCDHGLPPLSALPERFAGSGCLQ